MHGNLGRSNCPAVSCDQHSIAVLWESNYITTINWLNATAISRVILFASNLDRMRSVHENSKWYLFDDRSVLISLIQNYQQRYVCMAGCPVYKVQRKRTGVFVIFELLGSLSFGLIQRDQQKNAAWWTKSTCAQHMKVKKYSKPKCWGIAFMSGHYSATVWFSLHKNRRAMHILFAANHSVVLAILDCAQAHTSIH